MATITTYVCDICGTESKEKFKKATSSGFNSDYKLYVSISREHADVDICEHCRVEMALKTLQKLKDSLVR